MITTICGAATAILFLLFVVSTICTEVRVKWWHCAIMAVSALISHFFNI